MLFGLLFCKHCFINIYNANKEDEDEERKRKTNIVGRLLNETSPKTYIDLYHNQTLFDVACIHRFDMYV